MSEGTFDNPEVVEIETDLLLIGGGMAACGTAFEARRWASEDLRIIMVDKAAVDRSGAVAQGLSAINTYIGENTPEDYVRMVHADLMGITRDDLVYDIGRHVDDTVHLFEEWGLPIWKSKETEGVALKDGGVPVRTTPVGSIDPYGNQPAPGDLNDVLLFTETGRTLPTI